MTKLYAWKLRICREGATENRPWQVDAYVPGSDEYSDWAIDVETYERDVAVVTDKLKNSERFLA